MRTIAVSNQKGGCGKTTTAINLAVALAHMGDRVLIVDLDPQSCTTQALSGEPDATGPTIYHPLINTQIPLPEVVVHTNVERLDLVPSNVSLAGAEMELIGKPGRELRLAQAFRGVRDNYDFCVIDCAPSLGVLTLNALVVSTDVIVPIQVDSYALKCAQRLLETVLIVRQRFNRYCAGNLRILLTCVEDRTALGKRIQQQMRELFGDLVLDTVIHRTVTMAEALAAGQAVLTYAPGSAAAAEYASLAEELLRNKAEPMKEESLKEVAAMAQNALGGREMEGLQPSSAGTSRVPRRPIPEEPEVQERPTSPTRKRPRRVRREARPMAVPQSPEHTVSGTAERAATESGNGSKPRKQPAEETSRPSAPSEEGIPARPSMEVVKRAESGMRASDLADIVDDLSEPFEPDAYEPETAGLASGGVGFPPPRHRPVAHSRGTLKKVALGLALVVILIGIAAGVFLGLGMINKVPVANPGSVAATEDTPLAITLAGVDRDQDRLTYHVTEDPLHGKLSGTPPQVIYMPESNYNGPDSFVFVVNDGKADSEPATVSILVNATNDAPVAIAQSAKVDDSKPAPMILAASDTDGDKVRFSIVSQPKRGTLRLGSQFVSDGTLVYVPRSGSTGTDSFTFKVNDGTADSAPATVSVNIAHVNIPPVANDSSVTTQEDVAVPITLAATDSDEGTLTYAITRGPASGTLEGTLPKLRYVPGANFHGTDTFSYEVSDGQGGTDTAMVTILVSPVNDAPLIGSEPLTVAVAGRQYAYDVNATDPDGEGVLTYALVENPAGMSIDPASGLIQWAPTDAQMGTYNVVVEAVDNGTPPAMSRQSFDITVGPPMPQKTILAVSGVYDQKSQKTLSADGDIRRVMAIDEDSCQTLPGYYTIYDFSNVSIPADARILSVSLCVNHFEESQFSSGRLEWKVGTGWPASPSSWASMSPSIYEGQPNKGTLAWDLKSVVDTPEKINGLQLQVKNNCTSPQKATFVDRVYVEVHWQ